MTKYVRGRAAAMAPTDDNRRWWTLAAMSFALFMIMLDNTVVNVALPSIQKDLGADLAALEWTVNAYTLAFAVLLVTGGRLGDIFGRRKMFLFGVVVFALASGAIGFSPDDTWLITFRAIQGVGAAFMMPATLSILTNTFPPEERGKAIGTWAGVSAIALAVGPLVGGFFTQELSWQAIFFLNIPVAILAVVVTLFATRESRDETVSRRIDFPGILTLSFGLSALVLGLVEGNTWGWDSAAVIGLFAFAILMLGSFVLIEQRVKAPMVDFRFFRSKTFVGANIVAFCVSFGMLAMFFFLALYMQNILGYSPLEAGARFLPSTLVVIVMGPIAGRLADRIGPRPLMTAGLLIVSASLLWQTQIEVDTSYWVLLPAFVMMGFGIGLVMSPMSTAAMNSVEPTKAGVASGVLSMNRMIGGTFGVAALGALLATIGSDQLAESLPNMSSAAREHLTEALGSGAAGNGPPAVVSAAKEAFVSALSTGLLVSASLVALGAVAAWFLVDRNREQNNTARAAAAARGGEPASPAVAAADQPAIPVVDQPPSDAERVPVGVGSDSSSPRST